MTVNECKELVPLINGLEALGYIGLNFESMAAHLLVNCHDPKEVYMHVKYDSSVDTEDAFLRQFLPYNPGTGCYMSVDPLQALYEAGRKHFETIEDAKKHLGVAPLTANEQQCLDDILGDKRFPYALRERMINRVRNNEFADIEDAKFK